MSKATARVLKNSLTEPQYNYLIPEREFWDAEITADELRAGGYFEGTSEARRQEEDVEMGADGEGGRFGECLLMVTIHIARDPTDFRSMCSNMATRSSKGRFPTFGVECCGRVGVLFANSEYLL